VLRDVAAKEHPDVWLVADRWSQYAVYTKDGSVLEPGDPRRRRLVEAAWRDRLTQLTAGGAKVIVVLTPPSAPPVECATDSDPPPECNSGSHTTADPNTVAAQRATRRGASGVPGVAVVDVDDLACPDNGRCPAVVDGLLTRYDGVHYTGGFSSKVLDVVFQRAAKAGVTLSTR
jgi:hypothetical protein